MIHIETFLSLCILSETVCDKGTSLVFFKRFLRNRSSDNIESNTKTLSNENETRLLRKMVYKSFKKDQRGPFITDSLRQYTQTKESY
jgi:hypothetical protein